MISGGHHMSTVYLHTANKTFELPPTCLTIIKESY
jgi:hypothetical protein